MTKKIVVNFEQLSRESMTDLRRQLQVWHDSALQKGVITTPVDRISLDELADIAWMIAESGAGLYAHHLAEQLAEDNPCRELLLRTKDLGEVRRMRGGFADLLDDLLDDAEKNGRLATALTERLQ